MARESVRDKGTFAWLERFPASHWKHLHRVRSPQAPADVTIDHLLVGPSGIYVVVRRPGALEIDLQAARAAAGSVGALLSDRYRHRVAPVLCVDDDDPIAERHGEVLVTGFSTLEHIARSSPVVLSTSEVNGLGTCLGDKLDPLPVVPREKRRRWKPFALLAGAAATAAMAAGLLYGVDLDTLVDLLR